MKVAIVGVGNLGSVIAKRLVESGVDKRDLLLVTRGSPAALSRCAEVGVAPGDLSRIAGSDLVIIAVKPQDALETCGSLRGQLRHDSIVVSVMAGVACTTLQEALAHDNIARIMPNLGAAVGESASTYFVRNEMPDALVARVEKVVCALGKMWRVQAEELLDVATAVAGSGPAYLCWLGEIVECVARDNGFSESEAHALVLQTFKGAVAYLEYSAETFTTLRARVTSPRGTTAAAVSVLEGAHVQEVAKQAINAALSRARELGKAD